MLGNDVMRMLCWSLAETHVANRFLPAAEDVDMPILHVEDPTCVLDDGTKRFGVTTGNLPPTRFWSLPLTIWGLGSPGNK